MEDIPVKYFRTLFRPIYALDAHFWSTGGAGPPKWEPRSRILVYLVHSPFHASSMALVWNPTTGRVSPQYHVVFDNNFTTMSYIESGTISPKWENIVKHSSEMATTSVVDLAYTWLNVHPKRERRISFQIPSML